MVFWLMAAILAALVAGLLIRAAQRPAPSQTAVQSATRAEQGVYRDQMAEVERDLARGTISAEEAARLRSEVGRRLLNADRAAPLAPAGTSDPVPAILIAVTVAAAGGLYWWLGAAGYPDQPLAERLALADQRMAERPSQAQAVAGRPAPAVITPDADFAALMDKLRAALATRPDDLTGLALLARNEAALGNLQAAIAATARILALKGDATTAEDHAGMAELLIRQAGGYVSPEAEAEIVAALQRDPKHGAARYFSGLLFAQSGRFDRSFALWRPLLEDGPADAPWAEALRAQMPEVAERAGIRYALPAVKPAPGPDAADVAAAAEMSETDRAAMIEGMVATLEQRLMAEGGEPEEWARLIRSYGTLGRVEDVARIHARATTVFAGQASALSFLKQAAVEAGLAQ